MLAKRSVAVSFEPDPPIQTDRIWLFKQTEPEYSNRPDLTIQADRIRLFEQTGSDYSSRPDPPIQTDRIRPFKQTGSDYSNRPDPTIQTYRIRLFKQTGSDYSHRPNPVNNTQYTVHYKLDYHFIVSIFVSTLLKKYMLQIMYSIARESGRSGSQIWESNPTKMVDRNLINNSDLILEIHLISCSH
jgi:hypothetical protein